MSALRRQLGALRAALQFLTTLPVPAAGRMESAGQAQALPWYPVVGLLLGSLIVVLAQWLRMPFYAEAAVLLVFWVALTGALHLDGLADCADAWLGGLGDKERTLRILKDPLCGALAVVALVSVLLLKVAALAALVQGGTVAYVLLVPALARGSALLLFRGTAYVRAGGLGESASRDYPRTQADIVLLALSLLCLVLLPATLALAMLLTTLAVFVLVRRAALRRLGGFTGDIAGAQIELVETALLFVLVAAL